MILLKNGDEGTFVQWLQMLLTQQGNKVVADGTFGNTTVEALKKFQSVRGLVIDGIAGEATQKALKLNLDLYRWNGNNKSIAWVLGSTFGISGYNMARGGSDQMGTKETITRLAKIGTAFFNQTKNSIQVGDISRLGGGVFPPHKSHQKGDAADVRPIRKDRKPLPIDCREVELYDSDATKVIVLLVKELCPSARILFNDTILIKQGLTVAHVGHYNHLHIQF